MNKSKDKKNNFLLIVGMVFFSIVSFVRYFPDELHSYNSTLLAFSYKYGFMPRALEGTVYSILDKLVPIDLYTNQMAKYLAFLATFCFFTVTIIFLMFVINTVDNKKNTIIIAVFLMIVIVPTYCYKWNMGRVDIIILSLTFLAVIALIKSKFEWILPIICVINLLNHEGYVFLLFNVIIVSLIYKIFSDKYKEKRRKYIILLSICVFVTCAIFLYFVFFKKANIEAYEDILARAYCLNESPHMDLLRAEILGVDLFWEEWNKYHIQNFVELPIYVFFFVPIYVVVVKFFKKVLKNLYTVKDKIKYYVYVFGGITILPMFLLKVDYGRWIVFLYAYYAIETLYLLSIKDERVVNAWNSTVGKIREKSNWYILIIPYTALFTPYMDLSINHFTSNAYDIVMQVVKAIF